MLKLFRMGFIADTSRDLVPSPPRPPECHSPRYGPCHHQSPARHMKQQEILLPRMSPSPVMNQDSLNNVNNNNTNVFDNTNYSNTLQLPPVTTPRNRSVSFASTLATTAVATRCESPPQSPVIDLEDVEDHIKPVYLRESSIYNAYVKQKEKQEKAEQLGAMLYPDGTQRRADVQSQPKWKVCEPDLNAWRENTIDSRNLYSVSKEDLTLLSSDEESEYEDVEPYTEDDTTDDEEELRRLRDDLKRVTGTGTGTANPAKLPMGELERMPTNVTFQREKSYIMESRVTNRSPEVNADSRRFWSQTIKEFNRPTQKNVKPSYCSPKTALVRQKSNEMKFMKDKEVPVEPITRVPPHLRILPRLLRGGDMCRKPPCAGKQFCDVLGPETCRACIEFANRRVAGEVQRQAFPGLDCTVSTLVAPMLSKCLVGTHNVADFDMDDGQSSIASVPYRSRRSHMSRSYPVSKRGGVGLTRLPTITETVRYGRAGMERGWEENARRFGSQQELYQLAPPMYLM